MVRPSVLRYFRRVSNWVQWDGEDDWAGPSSPFRVASSDWPPRHGVNWLAVVTLVALFAWVVGMVCAGSYAHSVGYPPVSFDHDPDYIAPTDLQNRVRGVWATLELISLAVSVLAVALSGASFALRRERVTAAIALGVSVTVMAAAVVVAIFGAVDFVFRD